MTHNNISFLIKCNSSKKLDAMINSIKSVLEKHEIHFIGPVPRKGARFIKAHNVNGINCLDDLMKLKTYKTVDVSVIV